MRVLIGCEFSGTVRDEFIKRGHDAWSCDLLDTEKPGPHIKGDVLQVLGDNWDLAIFHPECTHLAASGAKHFEKKRADGRQQAAIEFFMKLVNAPIPKIAIENPIGIMSSVYRKPDQIVQPFWFGDEARKSTCLWLKNLPLLKPTNMVSEGEKHTTKSGKVLPKWYNLPPSPDRWKKRSLTFPGLAKAFATQWG